MNDFGHLWLYIIVQHSGRHLSVPVAKTTAFKIFTFKYFSTYGRPAKSIETWTSHLKLSSSLYVNCIYPLF